MIFTHLCRHTYSWGLFSVQTPLLNIITRNLKSNRHWHTHCRRQKLTLWVSPAIAWPSCTPFVGYDYNDDVTMQPVVDPLLIGMWSAMTPCSLYDTTWAMKHNQEQPSNKPLHPPQPTQKKKCLHWACQRLRLGCTTLAKRFGSPASPPGFGSLSAIILQKEI